MLKLLLCGHIIKVYFTEKITSQTISHFITFYNVLFKQHVTYHLLRNGARASKSPSMNGNDRRRSEEILSLK